MLVCIAIDYGTIAYVAMSFISTTYVLMAYVTIAYQRVCGETSGCERNERVRIDDICDRIVSSTTRYDSLRIGDISCDCIRCDSLRHYSVHCDSVRNDVVRNDIVRNGVVRIDSFRCCSARCSSASNDDVAQVVQVHRQVAPLPLRLQLPSSSLHSTSFLFTQWSHTRVVRSLNLVHFSQSSCYVGGHLGV